MSDKVYLIHVSNPTPSEYHPYGQEYIDHSKGAFTSKETAEGVLNMMRMFQEVEDETRYSVREYDLRHEATLEDWIENHGPGAKRKWEELKGELR